MDIYPNKNEIPIPQSVIKTDISDSYGFKSTLIIISFVILLGLLLMPSLIYLNDNLKNTDLPNIIKIKHGATSEAKPTFVQPITPTISPTNELVPTLSSSPQEQLPPEQMYYKNITHGENLLNNISKTNKVTLLSGLECELLEAENLGKNFVITNKKIELNENDWFLRIKVKATNPNKTSHTLDLDLTDGIKNIYLYEYSLDGQTTYPKAVKANSTEIIEIVMLVTNPHENLYLLPREYSYYETLEIIPLNI